MFDFGQLFSAFGSGMQAVSAYNQAKNTKASLTAQSQVAENNATLATWQAADAEVRGEVAANNVRLKGAAVKGTQRAALAANNVDLAVGSAQNILNDTDYLTAIDASTLENNAAREAWGYKMVAKQYRQQGAMAAYGAEQVSPWLAAGTSLLSAGGRVAARWYGSDSMGAPAPTQATQTRQSTSLDGFLALNNNFGTSAP